MRTWRPGPLPPHCIHHNVFCPFRVLPSSLFSLLGKLLRVLMIAYAVGLFAMILAGSTSSRSFLGLLFSDLGRPHLELGYDGDCASLLAVHAVVFDVYTLIHFVSWLLLGVVVRDFAPLFLLGVFFEFVEWCASGLLPHFRECLWDTWLLDVFGCNLAGQLLGVWLGVVLYGSPPGPSKILPLLPPRPLTLAVLAIEASAFLTRFMLKAALWVPSAHVLNLAASFLVNSMRLSWALQGRWALCVGVVLLEVVAVLRTFEPF